VNHPSRVHYPENKKPRVCASQYDFLFNTGRGKVELYNQDSHGLWELKVNEYGKLEVAQQGLAECEVEAEDEGIMTSEVFSFPMESHLRDFLATNIQEIKPNGKKLRLFIDGTGRDGVEYPTDVGPIDILAQDINGNFVVIELKLSKGPDRAVGQVLRYMGWVQKHLASSKTVSGVLVASNMDEKLKYAVSMLQNISMYEYKVSFNITQVALQ
jgi:RecB family endonuclease NucS